MNPIEYIIQLLQDPRTAIAGWITTLGAGWVYAPLFLIIFIETGVVVFPFLPGDSLLFAAGVFAADGGGLSLPVLLIVVWSAAILGDQSNFAIGHFFGQRIVRSGKVKSLTPERVERTQKFMDKWGPLAIFLGRFIPFIRTFVPFFSGMGGMRWRHFILWNVLGGVSWSSLFTLLGYFFGNIPFVQDNFELVIILIVAVSVVPAAITGLRGWIRGRRNKRNAPQEAAEQAEHDGEAATDIAADAEAVAGAEAAAGAEVAADVTAGAEAAAGAEVAAECAGGDPAEDDLERAAMSWAENVAEQSVDEE